MKLSAETMKEQLIHGDSVDTLLVLAIQNEQRSTSYKPKLYVDGDDLQPLMERGAKISVRPHEQASGVWRIELSLNGHTFVHNSMAEIKTPLHVVH